MSGTMSKRQQARNEQALQELIRTVPGNNVCADCQARNPGWASWNLGIFICMWCASSHRKLGTHITKVKSLSIDFWDNDQVEHMKKVGNIASNKIYNPQNIRPAVPFDTDEEDPARDRFIRQKYVDKTPAPAQKDNTGSTDSDSYRPAVPPKPTPGGKFSFGIRSSSSIFPMSSKARAKQEAAQAAAHHESHYDENPPSPRRNKQSKIFGRDVTAGSSNDMGMKLAKLRDMGFSDEKRNATVLKGLGGNMEKTIETLIRLEGGGPVIRSGEGSGPTSRSRTPISPAGISFDRTPQRTPPGKSTNPFDMLDKAPPAQPQSSQSTGSLTQPQVRQSNPYQQAVNTNPYGVTPSQSQYGLNQSFQNMSLSPSQPLFPNHTGGFPTQQQQFQQLHQQSMTPPVPSLPQQYYPPVIYENPGQQPQQPQQNYNPFMQQQQQIPHASPINTNFQSNPYLQRIQTPLTTPTNPNFQSNPYMQHQGNMNQNPAQSPVEQRQVYYGAVTQPQQQLNPFLQSTPPQQTTQYRQQPQLQTQVQAPQQQYQQQAYSLQPQLAGRSDKRSILDLYNYPQLAPTPLQQQVPQEQSQNVLTPPTLDTTQQRNVLGPMSAPPIGNRNPFTSSGPVPQSAGGVDSPGAMGQFPANSGPRHVSQESVDAGGWQSGRHSPDAWGTISARSMR
ncbi:hypothetical protein B0O99DRAFT_500026 [Bisporella sp. PMI_857]|nr:hypothetical protein B0O99DRAFT_500026 [Bisporella sp. PMI_857]